MSFPIFIDTYTLIIQLLSAKKSADVEIGEFIEFLDFLYVELSKKGCLKNYNIFYSINLDSIERVVLYHSDTIGLAVDEGIVYLREVDRLNDLSLKYSVNDEISNIIYSFVSR